MTAKDHKVPHLGLCRNIEDLIAQYRVDYPELLEWEYGSTNRDDNGRVVVLTIEVIDGEACSHEE